MLRRYQRIAIAQETGWTLDYIDGLGLQDTLDCLAVMRALRDIESFHHNS